MGEAFVIQLHQTSRGSHYDFMLEQPEALATFRLDRPPGDLAGGESCLAERLSDHRKTYLTFEGPVSGNRGTVQIVDRGTRHTLERGTDLWIVELTGQSASGAYELRRIDGSLHRLTHLR